VVRDIENYGLLKITDQGRRFLQHPTPFTMVEDRDFSDTSEVEMHSGAAGALDQELYSILRDLRKKIARQNELPPYVIFQDPSLEAMSTTYPVTLEELQTIPGVGQGKAKRYGKEFVEVIKKYVDENEIERPEDLRVRTVPNKSRFKIDIIQNIDRKTDLDALAQAKGLDFDELLDEIESIVYSGTKINIDYYLEENMDEDHMWDIFDYFKESDTDKISIAEKELGPDYTEEEIRLVRIKFISEMGN
jgi:ATP-dependent DNA helicase RecQ